MKTAPVSSANVIIIQHLHCLKQAIIRARLLFSRRFLSLKTLRMNIPVSVSLIPGVRVLGNQGHKDWNIHDFKWTT